MCAFVLSESDGLLDEIVPRFGNGIVGRFHTSLNLNVFGRFNPESNAIAADLQDGDLHVVCNNEFFVLFSTDDKHETLFQTS